MGESMSSTIPKYMKTYMIYLTIVFSLFLLFIGLNQGQQQLLSISTGLVIQWVILLLNMAALFIALAGLNYANIYRWNRFFFSSTLLITIFYSVYQMYNQINIFFSYLLFIMYGIAFIILFLSPVTEFYTEHRNNQEKKNSSEGYRFGDYHLYCKDIILKGSQKKQRIYYFCKHEPKTGRPCEKPEAFTVQVNKRTGLPYLKRRK